MTPALRLGLLGGTFDPVHRGHVEAAEAAREALGLDLVALIPSRVPPHRDQPVASGYHRFAMAALAIQGMDRCVVSDIELRALGPSYSALTLRRLHAQGLAPSQIFFITGADAFAEIATWYDYPGILDATSFVVISRPGYSNRALRHDLAALEDRFVDVPSGPRVARAIGSSKPAIFLVEAPTTNVSATEVRRLLASGGALDGLMSPAVADYARRHGLYAPTDLAAGLLHDQD